MTEIDPPKPRLRIAADKQLFDLAAKTCGPIYWHDVTVPAPKPLRGGSCFVLRFPSRLVGITAAHVVSAYERNASDVSTLICQFWRMPFDLRGAVIDIDHDLDIATFSVSEALLADSGLIALDCTGPWPPPEPANGMLLSVAGFPEVGRIANPDRSAVLQIYIGLTVIDHVSDREIFTAYDPERSYDHGDKGLPPLGLNLSGCSGGLALVHGIFGGLHRWFPAGLVAAGPNDRQPNESLPVDLMRIRRVNLVRADGTIRRPNTGWLPDQRR